MTIQSKQHTCKSQCDCCHTLTHCVEATRRLDDLLLCQPCYTAMGLGPKCYNHIHELGVYNYETGR